MTASRVPSIADRRARPSTPSPRVRVPGRGPTERACAVARRLGRYAGADGSPRELVACAGAGGGLLVIDRDARTLGDPRLIAHLGAEEPDVNASVVCRSYLSDPRRALPRSVTPEDLGIEPSRAVVSHRRLRDSAELALTDSAGGVHRLALVPSAAMVIPELRWVRTLAGTAPEVVSLREVIGRLESYEPARERTALAVHDRRRDPGVSVAVLRAELERMARSRIVLNRGLREAVVRTVTKEGLSMSCIATRCGRVKRDRRGNLSGETSWLARRLGLAPEGGERQPTPWIHTDVLALIARAGLGVAPREVELG
jgi:hypothetical protein